MGVYAEVKLSMVIKEDKVKELKDLVKKHLDIWYSDNEDENFEFNMFLDFLDGNDIINKLTCSNNVISGEYLYRGSPCFYTFIEGYEDTMKEFIDFNEGNFLLYTGEDDEDIGVAILDTDNYYINKCQYNPFTNLPIEIKKETPIKTWETKIIKKNI